MMRSLGFLLLLAADILTRRNDAGRTGANLQELRLTPKNVKSGAFGKLVYREVDGNPYAQPLVVSGVKVAGRGARGTIDLAIVATEHNSVYAFDANDVDTASVRAQVWRSSVGQPVKSEELYHDVGADECSDLTTEIGITGTPAIQLKRAQEPKEGVIFVAAKSKTNGVYAYTLVALNLATGAKISATPIRGEVTGSGKGSVVIHGKRVLPFDAKLQLNRPALLLSGNTLYIAFGGHCDRGPYHGWLFAYDVTNASVPRRTAVLCDTPNSTGGDAEGRAGIWMSGEGPALDEKGFVYLATGDGTYDGKTEFGNSALKVRLAGGALRVADWFTPENQEFLKTSDVDLGSGGVVLIPNSHLLLTGGKEGRLYLVDRDRMGQGGEPPKASIQVTHPHDGNQFYNLHGVAALWPRGEEIFVYLNGEENPIQQYRLVRDVSPGGVGWKFDPPDGPYKSTSGCAQQPLCLTSPFPNFPVGLFGHANRELVWMPGGFLTVSASGADPESGVLWVSMPLEANANSQVVRGVLRALDASDVSKPELWDSEINENDRLGQHAKFCPPTVANGKVYMVTFQQETVEGGRHRVATPGDKPALVIYGIRGQ